MKRIGELYREQMVTQIKDAIQQNQNIFLANYVGLSGTRMSDLRKRFRTLGAQVHVIRNKLAQLALQEMHYAPLAQEVQGQSLIVWSNADSVDVSKTLMIFVKDYEGFTVQGGIVAGAIIPQQEIKELAGLPSRDVLLAKLLQLIQSPVNRILGVFQNKSRDLLSILKQLSEKKGGS